MDNKMEIIIGDGNVGLKGLDGAGFHYIFSYTTGGPVSLFANGIEWLYRSPTPTFWRAITDNDRGCGFHMKSGMWAAADLFTAGSVKQMKIDGALEENFLAPDNNIHKPGETCSKFSITYEFEIICEPRTTVEVTYSVWASGKIDVRAKYFGKAELPPFPVFGLRLIMPTAADGFKYTGLSGETYPDRMCGADEGTFEVEGLPVTQYMLPQDCGMHMETSELEITRFTSLNNARIFDEPVQIKLSQLEGAPKFAFSCLPYTAAELQNATHHEELPVPRRTVLCIYGAVRGVGGIDSWGQEVEPAFIPSAQEDHELAFSISF